MKNHFDKNIAERIDRDFKHYSLKKSQISKFAELAEMARQFARMINEYCPNGREKSSALTKIEESIMWTNASIARNENE